MNTADNFPELPGIDTADGLKRMMNKPALYEKVLHDFHTRFHAEKQVIEADIQAGDYASAERQAHSIKGLAGTIGALPLQAAAKALELALHDNAPPPAAVFQEFDHQLHIVIDSISRGLRIAPPP